MAYKSAGTQGGFSTSSTASIPSPSSPSAAASGDIVVQFIYVLSGGTVSGWDTGFTQFATVTGSAPNRDSAGYNLFCAWKLSSGSEPGSYSNTLSASTNWMGFSACWSGRAASPIVVAPVTTAAAGTVSPVTYALNGLTANAGDDLIWYASGNGGIAGAAVWTPPSGYTSRISVQNSTTSNPFQNISTLDAVSAGATGTLTGVETGHDGDVTGIVISLAASGGSAPVSYSLTSVMEF